MKNLILFVSLFFLLSFSAFAQSTVRVGSSGGGDLAYEEGDKIFQAGISFGTYGYGYNYFYDRGFALPLNASLELGLHENFSVGPYVAFARWGFNDIDNYNFSVFGAGARGSFHYLPLVDEALDLGLDLNKLDFYVTAFLGIESRQWSYPSNFTRDRRSGQTFLRLNAILGFRYKFDDKFGVYFEGGRGAIGYSTLGVSVHF
ncbi:MAG: hypothetical protein ACLFUB_03130 [Cyclobacteriaceae bacterium]